MRRDTSDSGPLALGVVGRTILGAYMVVLSVLLGYLVFALWPTAKPGAPGEIAENAVNLFGNLIVFDVSPDVRLILLAMVAGALGSYIHAATSFADYVGNRRIYRSWVWWYVLRPFVGLSLASLFYFVIRAGLFTTGATAGDISPFGIAAISGLVGMFAKQATDKLSELFDALFKVDKPKERMDRLSSPVPGVTGIQPSTVRVGSADVSLTIDGSDFVPESLARFGGADRPTTYVSGSQLTVTIPSSDLAVPGEGRVTVFNPPPGGGTSNGVVLKIE